MKVLVFGCGPAGLMAAHAAALDGADVLIMSKQARKSFMRGAQYLHAPIPMASQSAPFTIKYHLLGDVSAYRRKVYGGAWDGTVSPEDLEETHEAWDIREAYDWLWDTYGRYVLPFDADTPAAFQKALDWAEPDLAISTVPAQLLCSQGHSFGMSTIWATNRDMMSSIQDNTVLLNGDDAPAWYRCSRIQGWENTEWPGLGPKPPFGEMWEVVKPLRNNCDCYPQIHRMGRYGKWQKGVLSHESFYETARLLVDYDTQSAQLELPL